jgi:hypothetical protein
MKNAGAVPKFVSARKEIESKTALLRAGLAAHTIDQTTAAAQITLINGLIREYNVVRTFYESRLIVMNLGPLLLIPSQGIR